MPYWDDEKESDVNREDENQNPVKIADNDPLHVKVAKRKFASKMNRDTTRTKTAGEVRFVKDHGGGDIRDIPEDFEFDKKYLKLLSRVLWGLSCSMGHLVSSHTKFTKIKAVNVSPDGKLGGKGYIQSIQDMRTKLSNAVEDISNCIDTIHDEIRADHWEEEKDDLPEEDQEELEETVEEAEDIISDPESFAEEEYEEEVGEDLVQD